MSALATDSYRLGDSLGWLFATQNRGIHPGLERMQRLLAALGNPEKELRCLHVAGTNGKGSVCAFAESLLRSQGYRTGLYTSPHLVHFSERIQIDGRNASQSDLDEGISRLRELTLGWPEEEEPTFFELATALAFDLFARARCDYIVLETGLGGRLDATNTAPKIACAISPIALDHTEWLGGTLQEIAREKAGIFRPEIPAVIAPQSEEVRQVLESMAMKGRVPILWVNEPLSGQWSLGLAGSHQRENAALALALLNAAAIPLSEEAIRKGLIQVSWPGRFQRLHGGRFILDGAHNLHAVRQLVATWHEEFGTQKSRLIFGALADKDPEAMLRLLEPITEEIILVPVASSRSIDPSRLKLNFQVPMVLCDSLKQGLELAFQSFPPPVENETELFTLSKSPVLLAGSLFLVGEALSLEFGEEYSLRMQ